MGHRFGRLVWLIGVVTVVAAGISLLTACGDTPARRLSHDEYLREIRMIELSAAATDASQRFNDLVSAPRSKAGCRADAAALARDVRMVIDDVSALTPPDEVAAAHARFVDNAQATVSRFEELAKRVEAGNLRCGMPYNRLAYGLPSTLRAEHALQEFARLGYCININCGD